MSPSRLVACVVTLWASVSAFTFVPLQPKGGAPSAHFMAATVEETTIEKTAPGAGWTPEWEGRTGLPVSEFMQSDLSKPDLSGMWECPLTRWDYQGYVELLSHVQ